MEKWVYKAEALKILESKFLSASLLAGSALLLTVLQANTSLAEARSTHERAGLSKKHSKWAAHKSTTYKSTMDKSTAHKSSLHISSLHKISVHKNLAHKSTAQISSPEKDTDSRTAALKATAAAANNAAEKETSTPEIKASGLAESPGVWINMWHYPLGKEEEYCANLKAHGIRNLFVQTSRSNTQAITDAAGLAALIDACHRHKIRVIAWSFADLGKPEADADKLIAAALFESSNHERVDAVAGDLEGNMAASRVAAYGSRLRQRLGKNYPIMAVVFSPLNLSIQAKTTPWATLPKYFDVIAPMTYWAGRYQKYNAYEYTVETIRQIRKLCGQSDVEIHIIGDGMRSNAKQIPECFKACRELGATSASLYPNHIITDEQLSALTSYGEFFPHNSRLRLAAFRQMKKLGLIGEPPERDPSRPISRGEYYSLVVKQLLPASALELAPQDPVSAANLKPESAMQILTQLGLLSGLQESDQLDKILAAEIYPDEAFKLAASALEYQSIKKGAGSHKGPKTGGRGSQLSSRMHRPWDIAAANALPAKETEKDSADSPAVNYLEAAQIVFQARSGI